jgi:hypothetical protein
MKTATLSLHIPTQAANAADEWYVAVPWRGKWAIESILFAPATAVAIDGTDYLTSTITASDGAAGSDSATIASHTTNTGGTALALKTSLDLTVTAPVLLGGVLAKGGQIKIAKTVANAGKILDGTYTIGLRKVG